NIIHVNLNQQEISATPEEKQSLIYRSHDKPLLKQKGSQPRIPGSRGLFQTIQSLLKLEDPVWKLRTLKARGLLHIDLLLYKPVQEGTLYIHLVQLELLRTAKAKKI